MNQPPTHAHESPLRAAHARRALVLICVVVVLGAVKLSAPALVPILLGIFFAVAIASVHQSLSKRFPRWLSITLTFVACLTGIGALGAIFATAGAAFVSAMPELGRDAAESQRVAAHWLGSHHLRGLAQAVRRYDTMAGLGSLVPEGMSAVTNAIGAFVVVVLVAGFGLFESQSLSEKTARIETLTGWDLSPLRQGADDVRRYLWVKTALSALTGLLAGLVCAPLGLELAIALGALAFVLNFVPSIGSIIAALPAVALAWSSIGPGYAALVFGAYLVINVGVGNVLEPRWMGDIANLSPLVVVLSLVVWGFLLGATGAFLSVPLTLVVSLFCARSPALQWLAVLLQSPSTREQVRRRRESLRNLAASASSS